MIARISDWLKWIAKPVAAATRSTLDCSEPARLTGESLDIHGDYDGCQLYGDITATSTFNLIPRQASRIMNCGPVTPLGRAGLVRRPHRRYALR